MTPGFLTSEPGLVLNMSQISFVILVGVYVVDSEGYVTFGHTVNLLS